MTVRGYLMSTPMDPQAQPVSNIYRWATVTDNDPLEIQLDGDSLPLATIPDCLVDPLTLDVGDRVWTQLYGRKVIVHGAQGGGTGPRTLPNEQVGWLVPSVGGNTTSATWVDWPNAGGGPLEVTHVKRVAWSVIMATFTATGWSDNSLGEVNYGVRVDGGTDYDLLQSYHNTMGDHRQWAGQRRLVPFTAGSHTYRLRAMSSGNQITFDYNDTFTLSIREVAP